MLEMTGGERGEAEAGVSANLRHDLFQGLDGFLQHYLVWVVIRCMLLYVCSAVVGGGDKKSLSETQSGRRREGERRDGGGGRDTPRIEFTLCVCVESIYVRITILILYDSKSTIDLNKSTNLDYLCSKCFCHLLGVK